MLRRWVFFTLLLPFSVLYGTLIYIRNTLYDAGILKSNRFSVPVISVGNLSVGGAGKTPHIEWLTELLKDYINIGILSRGYKRKTTGFRWVSYSDHASDTGDEPLQYKRKYRDEIVVAVSESRAFGIPMMIRQYPDLQTILLDDAFQHREVAPGLNILLTAFDHLYTRDYILPAGRLREWPSSAKRADIIIVSKCPEDHSRIDAPAIIRELRPLPQQKVFFTYYQYDYPYHLSNPSYRIRLDQELDIILLSAIANTKYLLDYLENEAGSIHEIEFTDHHAYSQNDIEFIAKVYNNRNTESKIILTTEKDATRLEPYKSFFIQHQIPVFILPVKVRFHFEGHTEFEKLVKDFLLEFRA